MDRIAQGLEPEEEDETLMDDHSRVSERIERIGRVVAPKVFSKYSSYLNKAFTRVQLQFAKDMSIKLYMSNDFKNFTTIPDNLTF